MTLNGSPYQPTATPTISIWQTVGGSQVITSASMTQVGTTAFYYYNFSTSSYGTYYNYLITGDGFLAPAERYKYGSIYQEVPDRTICTVVANGSNTSGTFKTSRSESTDSYWNNALCLFLTGTLAGQVQKVASYSGSTFFITLASAFTGAPSPGDTFELINF